MIVRELADRIYILKNSYYMEYLREPSVVILAPWMVSLFREESGKFSSYQHVQGGDIDTIFNILVIESPKVKDFKDIEVY